MPELPDAVLFDLDGTLVDSEAVHAESIARAIEGHGVELLPKERAFVIGHAWQDIYEELRLGERTPLDLPGLQAASVVAKEHMFAEGVRFEPMPGAQDLVELVASLGLPMVIVSGSCRAEIEQTFAFLPFAHRFRFYLGADDCPRGKPAPDPYVIAADRLGVAHRRCLVFEDSAAGIDAALAAGMRVIATSACVASLPAHARQDQSRAHRVVDGLEGLTEADLRAIMAT